MNINSSRPFGGEGSPLYTRKRISKGKVGPPMIFVLCNAFGAIYPGEFDAETESSAFVVDKTICLASNKNVKAIIWCQSFVWERATDGAISGTAVPVGRDIRAEPLYYYYYYYSYTYRAV
jgi:hypothetical protein